MFVAICPDGRFVPMIGQMQIAPLHHPRECLRLQVGLAMPPPQWPNIMKYL